MPGFPDDQRVSSWTFPVDLSLVDGNTTIFDFTANATNTVKSFNDGKIHLLYYVTVQGTGEGTSTAIEEHDIQLRIERGLDNGGTPFEFYRNVVRLGKAQLTGAINDQWWSSPPAPTLVLTAGSVGTPNNMVIQVAGISTGREAVAVAYVEWVLN